MDRNTAAAEVTRRWRVMAVIAAVAAVAVGASVGPADAVGALGVGSDFNGDGYADLAISIPFETLGSGQEGGAVQVLYGSSTGLIAVAGHLWSQNYAGIADTAEHGDWFGKAVTTGDFDGDGFTDLAIGVPAEDFVAGNTNDGVVHVLYGSTVGLTPTGSQIWSQDNAGIPGLGESGDHFGSSLAAGDVDGDGAEDLIVGALGEDAAAGSVTVIYGSTNGLNSTGSQLVTQSFTGVPGDPESGNAFGTGMVVGDFGGDGYGDVAISWSSIVHDRQGHGRDSGGHVVVLRGTASGVTGHGAQLWSQDTPGIAGTPEAGDAFGSAMAAGDLDGSGHDELIVGVPSDNPVGGGGGAVHVILGSPAGLTAGASQLWHASMPGLDRGEYTAEFGCSLALGNFGGTKDLDVAIGACEAAVGGHGDRGGVYVVLGSPNGLTTVGDQFWSEESPGIAAQIQIEGTGGGHFVGQAVVGGNFDGTGLTDLAIGAMGEELMPSDDPWQDHGAAHVIYGGRTALTDGTAQLWMQGRHGLAGTPDLHELFSWAMG